jgi:hypothetical protein
MIPNAIERRLLHTLYCWVDLLVGLRSRATTVSNKRGIGNAGCVAVLPQSGGGPASALFLPKIINGLKYKEKRS